ncbi:PREDICTED: probable E3 ubiquitin-protein ligase RHG1A [Tarenaya hassleriana]|uniref:probable E3 ubiquitin-protein ligase RHG1A n=1 Tax=Tarenaya hassleriana TaxID=28532 RepID=UPI00053C5D8A|nr:PREDICTED: probable E3 ubiquitin-protein ligase RHG1A [Tarenaya hassleriana]XP_010538111.1 PREDICTED: probable E3 ubiquitin-protein ligase RHG1A [Tarenaya hassleriana]XP_010538112.1 PREDICTED: probable E3 ubiquitin-protein ligase RHG1A [Tarenaya hassleriana]
MQEERASLGSLSEALNFEHGSTSSNAVIDQQIHWENIHSLGDNDLHGYMISSTDTNTTFPNSVYHGQQDLHRFSLGEASSSIVMENEGASHNEQKPELGRFEERNNEIIDLNPLSVQSSSSNIAMQNVNLNAEFIEHPGDMTQIMGHPAFFDTNGPGTRLLSPGRGFEETSSRAGTSLEGRRSSCKRKALEGSIGQSSSSGGFRDFQRGESSSWTTSPAIYSPGSGLNISGSFDQSPRGLVSGVIPNFPVPAIAESSSRNLCIGINPSDQQETVNPSVFSARSVVRRPVAPSLANSSRLLPADQHRLGLRHGHALGNVVSQNPNAPTLRFPPISRNTLPPFRWSGGPVSGGSSSSVAPVDRNVIQRDESRSRSISRNILENPLFVPAPDLRNLARSQMNRNVTSGNPNIAGNVLSSSSRTGSSTGVQPSPSIPAWTPYRSNSQHYQRRLSQLVRRSLLSSLAADGTNRRAGDHPTLRSMIPPASPDELLLQPGGDDNGNAQNHAYSRAPPLFERQGDGVIGIPHSLRALTSASRGRSRHVTPEFRNVLDIMRRGENLRLEDVMFLDQSVLLGVADIHDRYREMRLDVDNMSYEELLALEERIGDVCTGLTEEIISNHLKQRKYKSTNKSSQETEPCCICQEEYNEGDDMGTLECGHDFHSQCVKEWLKRKNLCPICKTTGLNTLDNKLT